MPTTEPTPPPIPIARQRTQTIWTSWFQPRYDAEAIEIWCMGCGKRPTLLLSVTVMHDGEQIDLCDECRKDAIAALTLAEQEGADAND